MEKFGDEKVVLMKSMRAIYEKYLIFLN